MKQEPRLISARAFSQQQGLDYGYILRCIKSGELKSEYHGKRFKLDRREAERWLRTKQYDVAIVGV